MLIFKDPHRQRLETASFSRARIWAATTSREAHHVVWPRVDKLCDAGIKESTSFSAPPPLQRRTKGVTLEPQLLQRHSGLKLSLLSGPEAQQPSSPRECLTQPPSALRLHAGKCSGPARVEPTQMLPAQRWPARSTWSRDLRAPCRAQEPPPQTLSPAG